MAILHASLNRRQLLTRSATVALALGGGVAGLSLPGLLGAPAALASALNGTIGRQEIIDRAWHRFNQRPVYSWTSSTEGFRNDCSGYVSYAWNTLPSGNNGWTTYSLPSITHRIAFTDLRAGDILLYVGDPSAGTGHVKLFAGWIGTSKNDYTVLEHGGGSCGCAPPEFNRGSGLPGGYYPARYNRVNELDPYGTIRVKWLAGQTRAWVGEPTVPELDSKRGGRFQDFQRGMIIWNRANNQAWAVYGLILKAYRDSGSEDRWGFPVMDELDASASPTGTRGRFQKFENALVLWSEPTGAQIVSGDIRGYFEANGYETRFGYPTSGEIAETGGVRQDFELGSLHWRSSDRVVTWEPRA